MYEIFEKLLEMNGITIYKFCHDNEISESTVYTWKKKKNLAGSKLSKKICEYFDISMDFLIGKTNEIECKECGQKYNPLDEFDSAIHQQFHSKIIEAKRAYPSLVHYGNISGIKVKCLNNIRINKGDILENLQEYLEAAFSGYVYSNFEHEKIFNYDDFCKTEIVKLIENEDIPEDYIDDVLAIFGINKTLVNKTDLLLARISKNKQLVNILSYAEKLTPELLDSIEIQLKALSEKNKR